MNLDNYDISVLNEEELENYTEKLVKAFDIDCYDIYLEDNINNYKRGHIFLGAKLFTDRTIIGGICLERKPIYKNEIYIEGLFVDKKYRNQGVATNLIDYIVENKIDIFNKNKIELYLFCEKKLKDFYVKNGFYETDIVMNNNMEKVLRMDRNI